MRELTLDELDSVSGGIEDELILGALKITGIRAGMTFLGVAGTAISVGYTSYQAATYVGLDKLGSWVGTTLYNCLH